MPEFFMSEILRTMRNILFPLILRLWRRKSCGKDGKGIEDFGKKIKIKKLGKNIKLYGTKYTPGCN